MRERSIRCQRFGCRHTTWRDDGYCSHSCLVAATHAATSDRVVTATRSAGDGVTGFQVPSSAPFPAFSLPDRLVADRDAPASPLRPSQVESA